MQFIKGNFIRWTDTDDEGKFSHVGQVIAHGSGLVTFVNNDGQFTIPEDDGKFEPARKPKSWTDVDWFAVESSRKSKPTVRKPKRKRKKSGTVPTKLDQVIELLKKDPPLTRQDAIRKIVAAGISTPAGASTYFNSAKQHIDL